MFNKYYLYFIWIKCSSTKFQRLHDESSGNKFVTLLSTCSTNNCQAANPVEGQK